MVAITHSHDYLHRSPDFLVYSLKSSFGWINFSNNSAGMIPVRCPRSRDEAEIIEK